jgi:glycosyltransferase involved in cell wall biosynthesis
LQRADVFVLASLSEGISNAVLEAMACGLPIVTTDCGGMREAITDGVEGFVVPVRDSESMANALEKLIADKVLRAEMGCRARERILGGFTLERQVEQFLAMYEELVEE